jgi:hypothetical protein
VKKTTKRRKTFKWYGYFKQMAKNKNRAQLLVTRPVEIRQHLFQEFKTCQEWPSFFCPTIFTAQLPWFAPPPRHSHLPLWQFPRSPSPPPSTMHYKCISKLKTGNANGPSTKTDEIVSILASQTLALLLKCPTKEMLLQIFNINIIQPYNNI